MCARGASSTCPFRVLMACAARLTIKMISRAYAQGYQRGWTEAGDWWARAAQHVEEMAREIKDEER